MKEKLLMVSSSDLKEKGLRPIIPSGEKTKEIAEFLGGRIFGQDLACGKIAKMLLRAQHALNDPTKPLGSVLLLGPTGCGKSESARVIGEYLLGDKETAEKRTIWLDGGAYQQEHDVKKITGSPNSYVGYGDPPAIPPSFLSSGRGVVVIDEIEKAHPALYKILLGILGDGRLTVNAPVNLTGWMKVMQVELSFSDIFFVITSNLGAGEVQAALEGRRVGFQPPVSLKEDKHKLIESASLSALNQHFKGMPELLGRIDEIIVYEPLEEDWIFERIVDKFTDEFNQSVDVQWRTKVEINKATGERRESKELARPRIAPYLALTREAKRKLYEKRDRHFGARDVKREFQKLSTLIAELLGEKQITPDDFLVCDFDGQEEKFVFYSK